MVWIPKNWGSLIRLVHDFLNPKQRDLLYADLAKIHSKPRNWYKCRRKHGVVDFVMPSRYVRAVDKYPRVQPRGPGEGGVEKKFGLIGAQKTYRRNLFGRLSAGLFEPHGYHIAEVDLVSCHLKVLADLNLKTPQLKEILSSGKNVWEQIIGSLSERSQEQFGFSSLKANTKILAYKCLQGGRIDTLEKIYRSIKPNEEEPGSFRPLAAEFLRNSLLKEFDRLNAEIIIRLDRDNRTQVFTPFDELPFVLKRKGQRHPYQAGTDNPCRVASQVVTGVEMFEILALLETMIRLRLPWIPLSLHHDGCALLVKTESFEADKAALEQTLRSRLRPTGICPVGLEYDLYKTDPEFGDELSDNRAPFRAF